MLLFQQNLATQAGAGPGLLLVLSLNMGGTYTPPTPTPTDEARLGGVKRGGWERWAKRQRELENEIRQASNAELDALVEALQAEDDAPVLPPIVDAWGGTDYTAIREHYAAELAQVLETIAALREEEELLMLMFHA